MTKAEYEECQHLLPFLIGECSKAEGEAFQRHLPHCEACRKEWEELRSVWEVIPFQMQEVPLPPDLKQEVMQSIIQPPKQKSALLRSRWTYGLAAAVLALVLFGSYWSTTTTAPAPPGATEITAETAQLVKTFTVRSDAIPDASGQAWMFEYSDMSDFVISLEGLTPPPEGMSYQVWLVDGDKYFNCGTLLIDGSGSGVLAYKVKLLNLPFDSVEVTLEADSREYIQPTGDRVMGTS